MAPAQIYATLWATTQLVALGVSLFWVAAISHHDRVVMNLVVTGLPMIPLIGLIIWYLQATVRANPAAQKASAILFGVGFAGLAYSILIVLLRPEQLPSIGSLLLLLTGFSLVFLAIHWTIHRRLTAHFEGSVQ